ncbi:hypothetical protein Tco_0650899 [Tanacetum coccineum]
MVRRLLLRMEIKWNDIDGERFDTVFKEGEGNDHGDEGWRRGEMGGRGGGVVEDCDFVLQGSKNGPLVFLEYL